LLTIIANDRKDFEYGVRKLMKEYEKWLIVITQKTRYGAVAENLVTEGNKEVRTCKKHKYLGITSNREEIDDQEINNK